MCRSTLTDMSSCNESLTLDTSKSLLLPQNGKSSTVAVSEAIEVATETSSAENFGLKMLKNYVTGITSTQPLCSSQPLLSPQVVPLPWLSPALAATNPSQSPSLLQSTALLQTMLSQATPILSSLNVKGQLPLVVPAPDGAVSSKPECHMSSVPPVSVSSPIVAEGTPPLFESPSSSWSSGHEGTNVPDRSSPLDALIRANAALRNQLKAPSKTCPSVSPQEKDLDSTLTPPLNPSKLSNLMPSSSDTSTVVKSEDAPTVSKKNVRYARKLTYSSLSEHKSDDDSNGEDFKAAPAHFSRSLSGKTSTSHMNTVII